MSILSSAFVGGRLLPAALIAAVVSAPFQAFADSSFRGFTVSDAPDQVEKTAKAQGVTVRWGTPPLSSDSRAKLATLTDGDNACGWITFNGDGKVESMVFSACFFNGEGLGIREVAQGFVDKFGGSAEMEFISDPMCKDAQPFRFKGRTSEGELFRIEESCANWKLEVVVEVKPGSGKGGLKF